MVKAITALLMWAVFTSAFADTPTITDVTARQRYPWNGLVDVDVAFEGPSGEHYRIELSARDEAGGTNLPVRTAWLEGAPGAVGNPVDVPAPGAHRLVWNAEADLPAGFVADSVTISAKLLDPVWSFESIPAIDPNDEWAPETVYHDVQTVVSYGEIEDRTPTIRCLTDEWNLADRLGANVVFSGSSMGLRKADDMMRRRGVEHPVVLWAYSDATNVLRMVTLDYETGAVAYDLASVFLSSTDIRFFSMRGGGGRAYADLCRNGYDTVFKSANTDFSSVGIHCRYGDEMHGSAVCGYLPNGIPWSDASSTSTSSYNKATNAAVFLCGTTGTDLKQAIVGLSGGVPATSKYSCMKNPTGRYVVPLLDANTYFTAGCGTWDENAVQTHRVFMGDFSELGGEIFDLRSTELGSDWIREPEVAYSKAVAMPDGVRFFFGGAGRDADGTVKMWCGNSDQYAGGGIQDDPEGLEPGMRKRVYGKYPAGHPFESWARRDVTCLLPNGKFCGVDEELGLVVVNPLTGETYVASDDPAFKKGKMGCQLLPNGKVLVVPYDCEGREYLAGTKLCGKLYEVDFGFTRSFSLSSLMSPYLRVAEGDPEPSGVKVGLDPNGGELPGVFAQYYKGESPVYGELPVPTRSDYTFLGWSTDGTAANMVSATDPVPSSGIRLKAAWALDHRGIQLWEGGPFWAETNIGAENPWDYGYYFWWGDIIGYKRENNAWIASDGSSQNFSFSPGNTPTYDKNFATLQSEGWITEDGVLAPEHDAAQAHWAGSWRMPTQAELSALSSKCVWKWMKTNGVYGAFVCGRDDFANASIFLPAARDGYMTSLEGEGHGFYWSSAPQRDSSSYSGELYFYQSDFDIYRAVGWSRYRVLGQSVRPVRDGN